MFDWINGSAQLEQVFWGRPVSGTILIGLFVAALVLAVFAYRKPIMEIYWVHQLENKDNRFKASRKLAELE